MAVSTLFLLLILMIVLDLVVTYKLYKTTQEDQAALDRELMSHVAAIKHEVASYRLSIDGKIEKAIAKSKSNRSRHKSKDEGSKSGKNKV